MVAYRNADAWGITRINKRRTATPELIRQQVKNSFGSDKTDKVILELENIITMFEEITDTLEHGGQYSELPNKIEETRTKLNEIDLMLTKQLFKKYPEMFIDFHAVDIWCFRNGYELKKRSND